ncbi:MAG: acyl-CoA dehydrogenase, partial [Bacteroidota bacterium]
VQELMSVPDFSSGDDAPFAKEKKYIANFKKAVLLTAGAAAQKIGMQLAKEQEILMNIADMVIDTYVAESLMLRVEKLTNAKGAAATEVQQCIMKVYINDAADRIHKNGKEALNAFAEGDEQRMMLMGIKRFTKTDSLNTKDARRKIADLLISEGKYCL